MKGMREYWYSIESDCVCTRSQFGDKADLVYLGYFRLPHEAYSAAFWRGLVRKDDRNEKGSNYDD